MGNKVLLVDDDEKLRRLLKEYLEGYEFQVFTLADGEAVLNSIRKESPEIVILDIMLPKKDGLEVLKEIRAASHVPVIMLTAKGEEADRVVGLELGADALQTTFSNLVENALKYSPSGGRVSVEIGAVGDDIEVVVTNTADKIADENLGRIFEPFHRVGTKKGAGFGLGLAIVKKTIEACNMEEGFRIRIRLPRKPTEEGV